MTMPSRVGDLPILTLWGKLLMEPSKALPNKSM